MKQTHNAVLIVKRTSLYDWADKNLNQSASGGIDHGTEQNSCIGIWQNIGQKGKSNQAAGGKNLRSNDTPAITDLSTYLAQNKSTRSCVKRILSR